MTETMAKPMTDVFISNLPYRLREYTLQCELAMPCRQVGIYHYAVFLGRGKKGSSPWAILTLPNEAAAKTFLKCFGSFSPSTKPLMPLLINRQRVRCRASKYPSRDVFLVKSLATRQSEAEAQQQRPPTELAAAKDIRSFPITGFECGAWSPETRDNNSVFNRRYKRVCKGVLHFRPRSVLIDLEHECELTESDPGCESKFTDFDLTGFDPDYDTEFTEFDEFSEAIKYALLVRYESVERIVTDSRDEIFFTLLDAPRMYLKKTVIDDEMRQYRTRERIGGIDKEHMGYSGFSFVYKIKLLNASDHIGVHRLGKKAGIPPISPQRILTLPPKLDFITAFTRVISALQDERAIPYRPAFQLNALVSNGILPPECVLQLLPRVRKLVADVGDRTAGEILKMFVMEDFDFFGNADETSLLQMLEMRIQKTSKVLASQKLEDQDTKYKNMTYIHRVMITPTGVFLYGPRWDASNRVLREYRDYQDYFLRVSFCEENGEQFQHESRVTSDQILTDQFLARLDPARNRCIVIAGRSFEFLGFSNSSLKAQTCWFMAPFSYPGVGVINSKKCIERIGTFDHIRQPGKYAARVGQAFSDTIGSALVEADHEVRLADIKRQDSAGICRNFSDGVGKVSWDLVERIWETSERIREAKPTVFQIRYAGAKGMIALDPTLNGDKLCLRDSMVKFKGSEAKTIEICSWASERPLFLNRPLIKVLEDRQISPETFMSLQNDALQRLQDSSKNALLAANFLRRRGISSPSLKLPWMFECIHNLGVDFRDDPFLVRTMELSLLIDLRDIKYKGRIPVPDGVTLVGVMDETKFLEEGEIYINMDSSEDFEGRVMITRSPVHHPGDVQCANSVRVPSNSPLRLLRNCVVFSQKGDRPLHSMLAGGDLDGDLYNIIFDKRFILPLEEDAADYLPAEPIDLGRPVEATDVAQFFVDFIENNLVGVISNRHLLISDQQELGVYHPDALTCARLQSMIVDFPKTGVKVTKSEIPLASRAKPDFLAPGPRVLISKDKVIHEPELANDEDEDTFVESWYQSDKVLGCLYRAINEHKFLDDIRQQLDHSSTRRPNSLLSKVLAYMVGQAEELRLQTNWEQYIGWATNCRERYNEHMRAYMNQYSDTPWNSSLTEAEVFVGTIVGRGKQTRRQKDSSAAMKQAYDALVVFTITELRGEDGIEAINRCLACLHICFLGEDGFRSFAWVAVSVLMAEVDVLQKKTRAQRLMAEKAAKRESDRKEKAAKAAAEESRMSLLRELERLTV